MSNIFSICFELNHEASLNHLSGKNARSWLELSLGRLWIRKDETVLFELAGHSATSNAQPSFAPVVTDYVGEFFLSIIKILPHVIERIPNVIIESQNLPFSLSNLNGSCNDWFTRAEHRRPDARLVDVIYDDLIQWQLSRRLDMDSFPNEPRSWIWSELTDVIWEWDARHCGGAYSVPYARLQIERAVFVAAIEEFGHAFLYQIREQLILSKIQGINIFGTNDSVANIFELHEHLVSEFEASLKPKVSDWSRVISATKMISL
jgi:Family of unknown function (DUF5984)